VQKRLDAHVYAEEIRRAQDERSRLEPFTARVEGFDDAFGYEVSRLIHAARLQAGWTARGRKIGFTNPAMWEVYGVREPNWAYVYDRTMMSVKDETARCAAGRFVEPKIEPEIILHLRTAPPVTDDLRALLECIDWIAHGFEIVQSHFPGWRFRAADTIANSALHGMLLVGEPQPIGRLGGDVIEDLGRFTLTLACDGVVRERGRGANVLGNPLTALAHLIAVIAKQPGALPLQAGELVTTGTLTAAMPVRAGERWSTRLEGIAIPGCALEFTP